MKILVAEDDEMSGKLIATTLKKLGHDVTLAINGEDALEAYGNDENIEIIVSDWMMPDRDGLSFCEEVRKLDRPIYTYFILLTANVGQENHKVAIDRGVDDFLTKPLNKMELIYRLTVAQRVVHFSSEAARLKKMVTLCMYTGKVKLEDESWISLEEYLSKQLGTQFSHGISPEAMEKVVKPMLEKDGFSTDGL